MERSDYIYSTLKRKTPLKAKTRLKTYSTLQVKRSFRDSYQDKVKSGNIKIKHKKQTPYKPKYKYESIFTDDLKKCVITGAVKDEYTDIHIHHIFGGANKANSEKYHFLIPLRADWHDMADYGIHFDKKLDLKYKRKCQEYYLEHYGTREEFIKEFGRWW